LVRALYFYGGVGVLLLPWWHWRGLSRLDVAAGKGPWGFRGLISPGLVALWPWLLMRARRAKGHPRTETNAHRRNVVATES
jgi:hypothetical protein